MTIATTIRIPFDLRDILKRQAKARGVTLGQHLRKLAADEERAIRLEKWRESVAKCPPDDAYMSEFQNWESESWS